MKKAMFFALLSLVLPLVSSQPALASGKVYTIHNKTGWPIVVTFSTQVCKPYSFSHTIGAKSTGTITAPCGTAGIDVQPMADGKPIKGHHCWLNVKYLFGLNYNVNPANGAEGYCVINSIAPGL